MSCIFGYSNFFAYHTQLPCRRTTEDRVLLDSRFCSSVALKQGHRQILDRAAHVTDGVTHLFVILDLSAAAVVAP
jgi:hypothetical protein